MAEIYAENFEVEQTSQLEAGTVVVFNDQARLAESFKAYDRRVAGIVAADDGHQQGLVPQRRGAANRLPVALVGRAYCKVDAAWGDVEVGDLLTTSPTPGHAMRADDATRSIGTVIGKALARLDDGPGLIPVLVARQ